MRLFASIALVSGVSAVSPLVDLDYSTYEGTALCNGITQWLGVRFAAPPIADLRFKAPRDPVVTNATQEAKEFGKLCMSTGTSPPDDSYDEDCLFLNVFAPSNATKDSKLPVYFFIQGGGFNSLSNANYNGSGIVTAGNFDIIVVSINYRVGLYGFLAGEEIMKNGGTTNNGLRDQRKALEWTQKYISQFGGDPKHVVMGGDSAGAQAVTLQVTAFGGRDDGLFQATAAESQSFSALRTVNESQFAYNNLVIRTGCTSENDTLACLRNLTTAQIQAVNIITPFPGAQQNPAYLYGPVLDYDFVSDYTLRAYKQGKFVKVPAIYGDDTDEGPAFAPRNTSSYAEGNIFLQNNFPAFTLAQLGQIPKFYPVEGTPTFPNSGRFWRQIGNAYGELRYTCPGIYVSQQVADHGAKSWNYRWNVIDPKDAAEGLGVRHTVEIQAIWGTENTQGQAPDSYKPGGVNAAIVPVMQGYWTSFIRSFDPNMHRKAGTPRWEQWGEQRRLMFQTNYTMMESVPQKQKERCGYLSSIGVHLMQ
ncbi:uncharacterized protein MYCFIDRAFT_163104 [Pseudocercospora fijiensis CIRAD86]|uniref:Carboxylesterase type B domain-containing protein n=1 Tax=Pseudocercospora fijiensis (strain CIRAD86) TaxID=383855 RepID=M3B4H3_PSEFD|nr:uncharacterized protein MYCFIDRAFT_163104 [Pseudocercospora fijiensis CIRAD86]EME84263.1 hypothetical protein MYCFIDRAFT_163104 [Pseudocercospora fijiensis CIRAD86]